MLCLLMERAFRPLCGVQFDIVQPQHHKRQRTSGALPYSSVAHARSDAGARPADPAARAACFLRASEPASGD